MTITRSSKHRLFGDLSLTREDIIRKGPKRPAKKTLHTPNWADSLARLKETRTSAGKKNKASQQKRTLK